MTQSVARKIIEQAIDKVQRYGLPVTLENVRANIDAEDLTLGDIKRICDKHLNGLTPVVLKDGGFIIVDGATRERKPFWKATADEIEEQDRIAERSNDFDRVQMACRKAVVAFLREKTRDFGYEVYPELFQQDIDRIYAMHGLSSPGGAA